MNLTLKIPATKAEISTEVAALRQEIKVRQSEIQMLSKAVAHYQSLCDHAGQKTGYNEREGNWANPCPTCGYGY